MNVRVRYAPSPTGDPHVGNIRTAMWSWLFARHHGGSFLIRLEDTDQSRAVPGSLDRIFDSLRWLGVDWDEGPDIGGPYGPYVQSQRLDYYHAATDRLLAQGAAYPCFCTADELREVRERRQARDLPPGYDGRCRALDPADAGPNCHELMTARIAPVCAPSLLRGGRLSRPSDVLKFDLLHVLGYRDDWHRWFRASGLSDQKVPGGVSFDGSLMALEAAVNGDGIMLGRRPFIDPHLQSGDLVLPFGDRHALTTTYYLRWPEAARNRRDVTAVIDWLVAMAGGD